MRIRRFQEQSKEQVRVGKSNIFCKKITWTIKYMIVTLNLTAKPDVAWFPKSKTHKKL